MEIVIKENKTHKIVSSDNYNYIFSKQTGCFIRWGKNESDDPMVAPIGPEIADIEISSGKCLGKCSFCYKCNNTSNEVKYMTLDTYKKILNKFPKILTQVAIGITDIYANPDFFKILEYTREKGIIPNYTTHGLDLDDNAVALTIKYCGAVAVSIVQKEKSYNAIKKLTDAGMKQVNIHYMLSEESYDDLFQILDDIKTDSRLEKLNAIVLLQYKDKNPKSKYHSLLDVNKYKIIIDYCEKNSINYGFDSCSASLFLKSIANHIDRENLEKCAESCESLRMSIYINCEGIMYPCSFCEGIGDWNEGINVLEVEDFTKNIWENKKSIDWKKNLISTMINGCAECPIYNLGSI